MAIPSIGPLGMPDSQFQKAISSVTDKAALATGKAKEKAAETVEKDQLFHDNESVQLSSLAQQEAEQMQDESQQDAQAQVKNDQGTQNMEKRGRQSVIGFAAHGAGAKDEKTVKEKTKPQVPQEEGGDTLTDLELSRQEQHQAKSSGMLDKEEKKLRGKAREEELFHEDVRGAMGDGLLASAQQSKVYKPKELNKDEIDAILNRDPRDILKGVKPEHLATASMMVAGQMQGNKPTRELTNIKNPDNIRECALLAPPLDIDATGGGQIADIFDEAPPIPELHESSAAFT